MESNVLGRFTYRGADLRVSQGVGCLLIEELDKGGRTRWMLVAQSVQVRPVGVKDSTYIIWAGDSKERIFVISPVHVTDEWKERYPTGRVTYRSEI